MPFTLDTCMDEVWSVLGVIVWACSAASGNGAVTCSVLRSAVDVWRVVAFRDEVVTLEVCSDVAACSVEAWSSVACIVDACAVGA